MLVEFLSHLIISVLDWVMGMILNMLFTPIVVLLNPGPTGPTTCESKRIALRFLFPKEPKRLMAS